MEVLMISFKVVTDMLVNLSRCVYSDCTYVEKGYKCKYIATVFPCQTVDCKQEY